MIFGRTKLELKVGVFVFIGLVILSVFILSIGGFKTWSSGYKIDFVFGFVNGVKMGAPVRFAGVDVGHVKGIKFFMDPQEKKIKVKITGWVKKSTKIPIDSAIWVNTLGLLGEKYIEIMPGKDYSKFLGANQNIKGNDPMAMQEIGEMAKKIASDIDAAFVQINSGEGTIGKLIYDDSIYNNLDEFVADIKRYPWKLFIKTKEVKRDPASEPKKNFNKKK